MRTLVATLVLIVACKGTPAKRHESGSGGSGTPPPVADANSIDAAVVKAARPEHEVWNLVDNRHTAHRGLGGELVVDARSIGFARYTRFGMPSPQWQLAAQVAGERAAVADKIASVELPVIPEQTPPTQITMRVHADDNQSLDVRANGRKPNKSGRIALEAGWQTIAIPLDAEILTAGENVLALTTLGKSKQNVAVSWMRVGATHPPADQDPLAAAVFDAGAASIDLADGASLTWYVTLPEGAHLVAQVAAPCLVEVGARSGDASYIGGLLGGEQDRVDLSAMAGKTVRLSLQARDCPRARIVHPRVTVHGPAPSPLPKAEPPRYVLLWKLARLRADPGFDELSRASTVFRQFQWVDVDRAALGKEIAAPAKIPAVLIADATVETMLARFDQARANPFFMFADSSRDEAPQLSRAIAQLKSWGIWDQTMLIAVDRRELAIHDAARYPSGVSIEEGAEARDVVPTILDALGVVPTGGPGTSLVSLAQGIGRGWPRPSYATQGDSMHELRIGRWSIRVGTTGVPVVHDVVDDPGGAFDLATTRWIERRMLTDSLGLLLPLYSQWKKSEWGVVSNLSPAGARALDEAAVP